MNKAITKKQIGYYFLLMFIGLIYFFFLGDWGYILERDSATYLQANNFIFRHYFVYVAFLKVCEYIFGSELQLYMVFLLQSIFAIAVSITVTEYFKRKIRLRHIEAVLVFLCTLLPYGYSLPEAVATHYILTEGLSFSFFHLFLLFCIIVFLERKKYMMIPAGIMALVLMMTRSQLLLILVIYMGLWMIIGLQHIYQRVGERNRKKYWIALGTVAVIICALIPSIMIGIVKSGKFAQFTAAVSGRVFCTIEKQDREYLDEEYRELYDVIYGAVEERQQREPYFRKSLWRWEDIANSTNENTKMLPSIISEYCDNTDKNLGNNEEILSYMTSTLLQHHIIDYMRMTIVLCMQSLVVSIFIQPAKIYTLCWIVTFILYGSAIGLLLYSKKKEYPMEYRIPMVVTGVVLLGNVVITNLFFYGQQRYVVYCFGFFYISLFLIGKEVLYNKISKYRMKSDEN